MQCNFVMHANTCLTITFWPWFMLHFVVILESVWVTGLYLWPLVTNFSYITRTSLAPNASPCSSLEYWQSSAICISVSHRQNFYSNVTHRLMEYLSFIWVMHLLAVGYSRTKYLSFIWVLQNWLINRKKISPTDRRTVTLLI